MDDATMTLLGIILAVTGALALIITLVRGPNLGLLRRTGYVVGAALLVLGVALIYSSQARILPLGHPGLGRNQDQPSPTVELAEPFRA